MQRDSKVPSIAKRSSLAGAQVNTQAHPFELDWLLVGSAGLMTLPTKKVLLWIRSPGAMMLASTTRTVFAL
jgi:hypothetical protein